MSFQLSLKIVRQLALRLGVVRLFHQPGTVNKNVLESDFVSLSVMVPQGAEPILPIHIIRTLRRAPKTPGGPLALKDVSRNFSFVFNFGQRFWKHEWSFLCFFLCFFCYQWSFLLMWCAVMLSTYKSAKSCNVNVVQSLALTKKKTRAYTSRGRDTVSRALSASAIRDRVKHGQMRLIHSHPSPSPETVLHRAPRSLGSALTRRHSLVDLRLLERM